MSAFPSVSPQNPTDETIEFKTIVSEFENDQESAKQKRLYPRRNLELQFVGLSVANARLIWNFFITQAGKLLPFNYFYPFPNTYVKEYVGTGNDVTVLFNLPAKTSANYLVYLNNVLLTETTDYSVTIQGGADGADLLTMVVAPPSGQYLTFSFTGYLKVRCRFGEDTQSFETFFNRIVNTGLTFKGLLNA